VLAERDLPRAEIGRGLRIAGCLRPENAPLDPGVATATATALAKLAELGHEVSEVALPLGGWTDAFDTLVLAEEGAARGHFLDSDPARLTDYERKTLVAARRVTEADVKRARRAHAAYREHIAGLFETYDLLALPTTATTAFPVQERPREIDGQPVSWLWGAFPATAPFNVAGNPVASIPCGLVEGLPVGLQIVAPWHQEDLLLNVSEDLERALDFDVAGLRASWTMPSGDAMRIAP
jgi:Asp-tRNA(Asn)/Glu-tRNA(Gln) amidotransferase A subunit family amidase